MKKIVSLFFIVIFFAACKKSSSGTTGTTPAPTVPPVKVMLSPTTTYQTITGFGGANRMWGTQSLKPAEAQKAFGLGDGELGLSIFRVRLSSNPSEWPIIVEAVKEANKRGVNVLACPWSPPPALKSNNSDVRGYLLPQNYTAFKDYINEFLTYMTTNAAKVDVVSIQNEPDWKPSYESCDWTAQEMIDFLKAPGQIVGAKLAAPESLNFNQSFTNALLLDNIASQKFDIVAGHIYGGGINKFPVAEQQNKEIWMTEYLLNLNTGNTGAPKWSTYPESAKWTESLQMLTTVHNSMLVNWNAYIWWYLQRYYSFIGDGEEGTTNGEVLKRGYAFSHFSKYVRPGFVRIGVDAAAAPSLKITAYKKDQQTVVVIVNTEATGVNNLQLNGITAQSANAYTTTESINVKKQNVVVANNTVAVDIPAASVTTVVVAN